jgi:hypothetical protein
MKPERSVSLHEDFRRAAEIRPSSNRTFGLVFAAFFTLIALAPLIKGHGWRPWALALAALFFAVSMALPWVLQPMNSLWLKLGTIVQKVTNPAVLAVLFFGVITPMAMLMRIARRDSLRLKWDRNARSYWLPRTPPGPPAESMQDQF